MAGIRRSIASVRKRTNALPCRGYSDGAAPPDQGTVFRSPSADRLEVGMTARESRHEWRGGQRPQGEGELTARLMTAAKDASEPLSQAEVDSILGIDPHTQA